MNLKKFHIGIIIILIWNFSFSQEYTHYTIKDGLPSNHIYKVAQDIHGFIWIITDNGMVMYNGNTFTEFTTKEGLPTNDIWEIATTPDGKVWFFCKANKIGYIENNMVYAFEAKTKGTIFFPLQIIELGNTVFFKSQNIFYYLNSEKLWEPVDEAFQTMKKSHKHYTLLFDFLESQKQIGGIPFSSHPTHSRGKDSLFFWIAGNNYGIYNTRNGDYLSKDTKKNYSATHSSYARINYVNDGIQISDLDFISILNKKHEVLETIKIPTEMNSHHTTMDKTGNLWIATFGNGVYKLPAAKRKALYLLNGEKVTSLHYFENKLIACVFGKGYYSYNFKEKQFEPFIELKSHSFPPLIVGDLKREYYLDNLTVTERQFDSNGILLNSRILHLSQGIKQMAYFDDFIWGHGSYDLKKIDPESFKIIDNYPGLGINKALPFKNKLLLGTIDGLKKLDRDSIVPLKFNNSLFTKPVQNLIKMDSEWLLVCTEGYGAYMTNLEESIPLPNTQFLGVNDGFAKDNEIWLATNRGLYYFKKKDGSFSFINNYTEDHGLPTPKINGVLLLGDEVMVATDIGVAVFSKNLSLTPQLLDVYVGEMLYNSKKVSLKNPSMPYSGNNSLNVKVAAINYSEINRTQAIRYKLLPNQNNWIETNSGQIIFNDLKPNSYTLQIASSELIKNYPFTITPLWWQRPSFQALIFLAAVSLVLFSLYKYRRYEIKKKINKLNTQKKLVEFELNALRSQMNPHFVFNSLAAIQYYINENDFENSEKYLVKFSKLIRKFFEISKQSEITLAEEISLLKNYLEIEKLRFKEKLEYIITVDEKLDIIAFKIPTMLLQPVVENAVNHGIFNKEDSGMVKLNFIKVGKNEILVEITDDGVGFANSRKRPKKKLNSTSVLKERMFFLNQSNQWEIAYSTREAFPESENKGNISQFNIKRIE